MLSIVLIISGAFFTTIRSFPLGKLEMVDMHLRAEENWKRCLIVNCVLITELQGMTVSPNYTKKDEDGL